MYIETPEIREKILAGLCCILVCTNVATMRLLDEAVDTVNTLRSLPPKVEVRTEVKEKIKELRTPVFINVYEGIEPDSKLSDINTNFLNVKKLSSGKWLGEIGTDKHGHVKFSSPEYGIRAAAHVMLAYYIRHERDTLRKIVERFSTNNHEPYVKFLSKHMGIGPDEQFKVLANLPKLLRCMAKFECGRWLPERMFVGYDIASSAYKLGVASVKD